MLLNTASAVISFITKLEEETSKFYERLSQKYSEGKEAFLSFSKENLKNKIMVERTYYGVITDALEACFSFKEGIDSDAYIIKTELSQNADYIKVLKTAIKMEETIQKLYTESATLSKDLMADVPRVFKIMATKRNDRISKLNALMKE